MKQPWRLARLWSLQWAIVSPAMILNTPPASVSVASAQRLAVPAAVPSTYTVRARLTQLDSGLDRWGESLMAALQALVVWELSQCSLVVATDTDYLASQTLQALSALPNQKQVSDSLSVSW